MIATLLTQKASDSDTIGVIERPTGIQTNPHDVYARPTADEDTFWKRMMTKVEVGSSFDKPKKNTKNQHVSFGGAWEATESHQPPAVHSGKHGGLRKSQLKKKSEKKKKTSVTSTSNIPNGKEPTDALQARSGATRASYLFKHID